MTDRPTLSVVVPIYDVEEFLEECLESIAVQTATDLEVVMVDDGSPDRSGVIAQRFVDQDSRFRLIRVENGGLGRARNIGTDAATGEFLAFVDSDDVVPSQAYERMLASLAESGSDIACGGVRRLRDGKVQPSPLHSRIFTHSRKRTHVTHDHVLMYDRTAWNKVYRRSFWDEHGLRFPEGVLYEDIPVTLPSHFLAKSVDVIHQPVYLWRHRPGSITMRTKGVKDVTDRIAAVRHVSQFLKEQGLDQERRRFDRVTLTSDVPLFLNALNDGDADYHQAVMSCVGTLLEETDEDVVADVPALLRLQYHLVRRGLLDELLAVQRFAIDGVADSKPVRRGKSWYADYPFRTDRRLAVPAEVYRLGPELEPVARVDGLRWEGTRLHVDGWAFIKNLPCESVRSSRLVLTLVHGKTGRTVDVPVRRTVRTDVTRRTGSRTLSYDGSGFTAVVDTAGMLDGTLPRGTWHLRARISAYGTERETDVVGPVDGAAESMPALHRPQSWRVRPVGGRSVPFGLRVDRVVLRLDGHAAVGTGVRLQGRFLRGSEPTALVLRRKVGLASIELPVETDGRRWSAEVDLARLAAEHDRSTRISNLVRADEDSVWDLHGVMADGTERRITTSRSCTTGGYLHSDLELVMHRSRHGSASIVARVPRPVVEDARWDDAGDLVLSGTYREPDRSGHELLLSANGRDEVVSAEMVRDGDRFSATITPRRSDRFGGAAPLRAGTWRIESRRVVDDVRVEARLGVDGTPELPIRRSFDGRAHTLERTAYEHVRLRVESSLRDEEKGQHRQRQLAVRHYPRQQRFRLRDAILFDSFSGKQYSDSPRAVLEELRRRGDDRPRLWVVADQQFTVPDDVVPVPMWSREWFEAYARCRWIVGNQHLPPWFTRRRDQTVVQTWHGTPLKRIARDIETIHFASGGFKAQHRYLSRLDHEVRQWSHLVSPNSFSSPVLRRAFGFEGELLETGYPRNDVFYRDDRADLRAAVLRRLGIDSSKRVVLYAPTWRDQDAYGPGRYRLDLRVDLDQARRRLGQDHVLLVRPHSNVVDRVPDDPSGFVVDVSSYPDIAELMLVADVLVTDYSSVMFDFANTRKPMLFFTYDLELYRDTLRGFYFDFEQQSPGPLIGDSERLVESLRTLADAPDEVTGPFAERYARFVEQFCTWDDGGAAGRVIDAAL